MKNLDGMMFGFEDLASSVYTWQAFLGCTADVMDVLISK